MYLERSPAATFDVDRKVSCKHGDLDNNVKLALKGPNVESNTPESCQRANHQTENRQEATNEGVNEAIDTVNSV